MERPTNTMTNNCSPKTSAHAGQSFSNAHDNHNNNNNNNNNYNNNGIDGENIWRAGGVPIATHIVVIHHIAKIEEHLVTIHP